MSRGVYAELDDVARRAEAAPLPAATAEVDQVFARESEVS
jgi:hypothetical protein